jgi:hypothetical protein
MEKKDTSWATISSIPLLHCYNHGSADSDLTEKSAQNLVRNILPNGNVDFFLVMSNELICFVFAF